MMLWSVTEDVAYEGAWPVALFATQAEAESWVERLNTIRGRSFFVESWVVGDTALLERIVANSD